MQTISQAQTHTFQVANRQKVVYRNWKTDDSPKAVVVIVNCFNSQSGYYQRAAEQLTAKNFETYAIDLRPAANRTENDFILLTIMKLFLH